MATLLYRSAEGPFNQQDDPQNPGIYTEDYNQTQYDYDPTTKLVTSQSYVSPYVGGYAGAPPPPQAYTKPGTELVDRYTVPADPTAPGYDAAAVGKDRRVYHDEPANLGGLRFEDQTVCDLTLVSATAIGPAAVGGTGSIAFAWMTSSPEAVQGEVTLSGLSFSRTVADLAAAGGVIAGLPPGLYGYSLAHLGLPGCVVGGSIRVPAANSVGCNDEYAGNYDPAVTQPDPASCTYAPAWRSAWGPAGMPVRVAAQAGQQEAFIVARLRIGFRDGHPLAAGRPLGAPLELTATVGPDGYATFRLGHYLRSALGVEDGEGGRLLDLNSSTATTDDLFVGYELRRVTGELLSHGYALNAAVPDEQIQAVLSPFSVIPQWIGFDDFVSVLSSQSAGRYGIIDDSTTGSRQRRLMPCPPNPLPVAWLAPGSGIGHWVFQGRPQLGDDIDEGSTYQEPETGERRWSDRGAGRRTITASSGVFKGADLMEGLRTLWRSPQVWYRPKPAGPWVPVTLEGGSFPAGRMGLLKQQVNISFTQAAPEWAQGQ